jgi:amino acid transporter
VLVSGQIMRASADEGLAPAWLGKVRADGTPVPSLLVLGVLMSVIALATVQPSLGKQFGVLTNAAVVLSLVVYILCAAALWRFETKPASRALAAGAILFSGVAAVVSGWPLMAMTVAAAAVGAAAWLLGRSRA